MSDSSYWLVFLGTALALNLSPGPDIFYVVSRSVAQGRRVGLACAAGVWTGAFVHVVFVALGLSAILAASASAFALVKYAGAGYLVYLGISALRSRGGGFGAADMKVEPVSLVKAFRQGVLIDLLNPKVAIFFMAFLPQFVRPGHGSESIQIITLGALVIAVAIPIELSLVLAASGATGFFRRNPKVSAWLDRALGTVLISLGVRLALETRG